jgi:hypothetical protein
MSKWLNKDLFNKYTEERKSQTANRPAFTRSEVVWTNPKAGTQDIAEVYEGRLLSDPNGVFVKRYHFHMWKVGDKYTSALCPKTENFSNWCPLCAVVSVLYNGTAEDKALAKLMKRKERYVANFYITKDPRDNTAKEEKDKNIGKVKLYELPGKVEEKIMKELDDKSEGFQEAIFDPGKDGHNLIIEVKLTKPDAQKNTYPDYSSTAFSRKASSLGTDEQIEAILAMRHDVDAHIKAMERPLEKIKDLLTSENLFSLIERDWNKHVGQSTQSVPVEEKRVDVPKDDDVPDIFSKSKPDVPDSKGSSDDSDLMNDLENIKF